MQRVVAAACGISVLIGASAANANGVHRLRAHKAHHSHAGVVVSIPAERVAAFRRARIDWRIGPAGSWVGRDRYYYRPHHYWRGPLVYRQTGREYVLFPRFASTTFVCRETRRGPICRQR